jgi:hypothetical protein
MASLPAGCRRKLHLEPGEGLVSWKLLERGETDGAAGVEVRYEFVAGLRTRQRSTFTEFYIHYTEALALEAARHQGIPLGVFSRPDFCAYRATGGIAMPEGDWHRWRKKWIRALQAQKAEPNPTDE